MKRASKTMHQLPQIYSPYPKKIIRFGEFASKPLIQNSYCSDFQLICAYSSKEKRTRVPASQWKIRKWCIQI